MDELNFPFTKSPNYMVADKRVCFQSAEVSFGDKSIKLEPLPLAVLYYLIQHAGDVVSRQALLEHVWGNRQVSDDAIRRVIKKVRFALEDDAKEPRYIKTIPMQGYALIAPVQLVKGSGNTQKHNLGKQDKRFFYTKLLWITAALIVLILLSNWFFYEQKIQKKSTEILNADAIQIETLTDMSGSEMSASYHPKHDTLLFIYRENNDSPYALHRKNLTTGLVHRLSFDRDNYLSVFFSNDGQYVVYNKNTPTGMKSYIARYANSGLHETKLLNFATNGVYPVSFGVDNDTLYVSALSSGSNSLRQHAIYRYSISQNLLQQMTFPFVKGYGDYAAQLSPDGRYLALIRNVSERRYHLLIHDLEQQNIVSEVNLGFFASHLVWLKDTPDRLVLSSFKGDVYYFDMRTEQLVEQSGSAPGLNDAFYSCGKKCLFMRQHRMNYKDIQEVKNPFSETDITSLAYFPDSNADFNPIYNNAGDMMYFTSKNEQRAYIKSIDTKGQQRVLYTFNARHIVTRLSLDPTGTKLTGKIEERIFVLDIKSKQFKKISLTEEQVGVPHWGRAGQSVYYSRLEGVDTVLYRYNLHTKKKEKVEHGISERKELTNGDSYLLDSDYTLWLERKGGERVSLMAFDHLSSLNWQVHDDYVYWSETGQLNVSLNRLDVNSGLTQQRLLFENSWDVEFSLHPSGGKILVSHSLLADSNLVKVQWP
ncbi:Tol-Pal system protein TolB [Pseudoalteromonas holothuriae]|uniref:Tol-Pal system protein TolB n=1 Tax=Pseudoalteromonas holothuriae TaxID=2963714 RepID=A0ABN8UMK7_9GAMM|nr:winged helix-turn-helix domain-containing protein [Pseudoalteromonas sp. CIP111951]CAH9055984.1 Tol-Pal system protein TolB [Pseudoalteromonas sp. CIP111951]